MRYPRIYLYITPWLTNYTFDRMVVQNPRYHNRGCLTDIGSGKRSLDLWWIPVETSKRLELCTHYAPVRIIPIVRNSRHKYGVDCEDKRKKVLYRCHFRR